MYMQLLTHMDQEMSTHVPSDAQGAKKEITPECLYFTKTLT